MTNLSQIFNSGSIYEQLISQVIAVESQPRLKLVAEKSEQGVYKGVLSDFGSKVSALDTRLSRLTDPLQTTFAGKAATVGTDGGLKATATDAAATGQHELQVTQLARADARLSKQVATGASTLSELFTDAPGEPAVARTFTVHVAQPEGNPVDIAVSYRPPDGANNGEVLAGMAAAVNDAIAGAEASGLVAEGTGASASVVRETDGTSRLSLRSLATGYGNRLTFSDPDGLLAALELDRTDVRQGTGGGAVYAVGTGAEDSALSAAVTLDGLAIFRDSNTIDDALDGVTLTLSKVTSEPTTLSISADTKGMRSEIDAFISSYNGLMTFLTDKSRVDAEAGTRGAFAGDSAIRGLRSGLRADLGREVSGAGDFLRLADLGIETQRDGTLKITDAAALDEALRASPDAVGALFTSEDGVANRMASRIGGLLGSQGTIEQRKQNSDDRVQRLDGQIDRMKASLQTREDMLRAQFTQLQEISARAESQFSSISNLFFF